MKYFVGGAYNGIFFSITSRHPLGTNVLDKEWDLLIVLDACRVDALTEVASEFEFVSEVGSIWSVGSSSHEWLCNTFTEEYADEIAETGYISTNPHTPKTFEHGKRPPQEYSVPFMWADWNVVDRSDFKFLRQLHEHSYEEYADTYPPEMVTDHAIQVGREQDFERMIVHYFQPHRPYIGAAFPEGRAVTKVEDRPWAAIREGRASRADVWELYLENLRFVLESVERLLKNTDAETVAITADHGELFGKLGIYGHPEGLLYPHLRRVPWAVTTASDEWSSTPTLRAKDQPSEAEVRNRLENLGYV